MKNRGFTLLEVLVAAFILFLAISAATMVYSSAIRSKINATKAIRIASYAPLIRDHIKVSLESAAGSAHKEKGRFMGVAFTWQAKVIEQKPTLKAFSQEGGSSLLGGQQIKHWSVDLTLQDGARSASFTFSSIGWGE